MRAADAARSSDHEGHAERSNPGDGRDTFAGGGRTGEPVEVIDVRAHVHFRPVFRLSLVRPTLSSSAAMAGVMTFASVAVM